MQKLAACVKSLKYTGHKMRRKYHSGADPTETSKGNHHVLLARQKSSQCGKQTEANPQKLAHKEIQIVQFYSNCEKMDLHSFINKICFNFHTLPLFQN